MSFTTCNIVYLLIFICAEINLISISDISAKCMYKLYSLSNHLIQVLLTCTLMYSHVLSATDISTNHLRELYSSSEHLISVQTTCRYFIPYSASNMSTIHLYEHYSSSQHLILWSPLSAACLLEL